MPITPYLDGQRFDPEAKRILGLAFEMTCVALRIGDCDDGIKQAVADKIIDLAKAGERSPDVLCEQALKDIRRPEVSAASVGGIANGTKSDLGPFLRRFPRYSFKPRKWGFRLGLRRRRT